MPGIHNIPSNVLSLRQVAVVCGSCTAGGAYIPTMAEETIIVDRIGTIFLAGPPLVKAATGESVSSEDLGGAKLHSRVSGCVDHFAPTEDDAYRRARHIISTINYHPVSEETTDYEEPLYDRHELAGLAPRDYSCTLDVKLILSRIVDGSKFLEFKADYGTCLVTGFASIDRHLVGIVASNGELTHNASLKGCHFVQLCDQRAIPLLFLQNTTSRASLPPNQAKAAEQTNQIKAQASMMAAVACATVPKITLVIGGCHGGESFAMCGRSFSPNFLFLWPNARVAIVDPNTAATKESPDDERALQKKLREESCAFYSSARLWDDGVILPEDTREVIAKCLRIINQQKYQTPTFQASPMLRM